MRSRLALVIAGLCLATAASADWRDDYDRGVKAAAAGDWVQVDALMRSAIAQEGKPSERKRFQGVVHKVYVPQYYAGLAAWRQGDCRAALEFWSHRESKEVVALIGEMNSMQNKGIADCNTRLAAADKPEIVPSTTTSTPTTTPAKPDAALVSTTPPTQPPATTPAKPPEPATTKPVAPPSPAAGPAPAALVQNVQSFLEGRYAAVAASDPNGFGDARAKSHGLLLRAAARHTLAELAGGDARQLEQARADVRAARAANAALTPDEVLFSPRFRAFWSATR